MDPGKGDFPGRSVNRAINPVRKGNFRQKACIKSRVLL